MKQNMRRSISFLLALMLAMSLVSPYAWAAEIEAEMGNDEIAAEMEVEELNDSAENNLNETDEAQVAGTEAEDVFYEPESENGKDDTFDSDGRTRDDVMTNDIDVIETEKEDGEESAFDDVEDSIVTATSIEDHEESETTVTATEDNDRLGIIETTAAEETVVAEDAMLASSAIDRTQSEAVSWVESQKGKSLDYDNAYGAQCVDLIKYYYAFFGVASYAKGNGCDYVSNSLPSGWTRIKNTASFIPEPGDIAVWGTGLGKYGHVAIILSADLHSFTSMDQNWPSGSACKKVTHTYQSGFWGIIRPKYKCAKPATPVITSMTADSTTQITIKWKAVSDAAKYRIDYNDGDGAPYNTVKTVNSDTLSFTHKNLEVAHRYGYRVYAIAADGTVSDKPTEVYKLNTLCATPEMTHWAADGPRSITIRWNGVYNAKSYEIHRNTYVNGPYELYKTVDSSTNSFTDTGVVPENEYGYRVYAINKDGAKSAKPSTYYKVITPAIPKHAIDLNRLLDGAEHWELAECATADVWVNGVLVADDVSDYWGEWPEGYSYEVTDVKTKTGYRFDGIASGSLSGTVGGSDVDLRLVFSTIRHQLDLNGTRDGNYIYSLEDCATVDVYIDGNCVADDVTDFCDNIKEGSHYEFRDLKVKPGYKFEGIVEGAESGDFFGGTVVNFAFSTIYEASPGTQVLPDGWYMIVSGNDDDWVLDVNGWHGENGTNVELYHRNNTTNQRFYLHYLNNGFYSIQVQHSGKYIQKADTSANVFDCNVHQWDGCESFGAQWKLASTDNGYFFLEARNGGCLDNVDGNTTEGNNVRVYDFNGSNAQRWKFVSTSDRDGGERLIPDGWYTIGSGTDNNLVLDVCNNSLENGGAITLWHRDYWPRQIFYVEYQNDGYYTMRSKLTDKPVRTVACDGWCESVVQWDGVDKHSRWCLEPAGDGYYYIRFDSGNYLDHVGSSAYPLTSVISWMFNGGPTQKWKFTAYDDSQLKPSTTSQYLGHTYEFFSFARSWEDAKNICEARGGHLATITSEEENSFLTERLAEGNTYWLGGTDRDQEGTFSWITGESFDYTNWHESEPNNCYDSENYVEIRQDGKWNDDTESTLHYFICEYDPAPPIKTERYQNHVYELYDTAMTWDEARRFCDSKGGHLVTITSQGENSTVAQLVLSDPNNWSFWIAANDMDQEGTFVWSTGEGFQYSNWAEGEPNNINDAEDVAHTSKTGDWYDTDENIMLPFICEYDPDKTNISTCDITLSETNYTYDGNAKTPPVTVKHNNDVLSEGIHYTVSYQNNVNAGTAIVTITGKGDYVGSADKPFTITKPEVPEPQPVDPTVVFQVGNVSGRIGEEITIPVSLTKNSGIAGFTLDVVYDHNVLTFKSAAADGSLGGMLSTNGGLINWYTGDNYTKTGVILNLTFEIAGSASTESTVVNLAMHNGTPNVVDEDSENVAAGFEKGTVSIRSFVAGDVTGDGSVTIADVVKINRYVIGKVQLDSTLLLAADVTGDGSVTIADVVKVNRFVIGKIATLETAAPKLMMKSMSMKSALSLAAFSGAVVTVDSETVEPGATVEIPVSISGNPGIAGFAFELSVPEGVKINSVKIGSMLSGGLLSTNGNIISWYTGDNVTGNDVLLKLNVTAPAQSGSYEIGVALKDGIASNFTDENSDPVKVHFVAGTLQVNSGECKHEWDNGKVTTDATCVKTGVKTFTCSKCGETKTETIPLTSHNYTAVVTKPTCTAQGYTTHTCRNCGQSYKDAYTDIIAHDYHAKTVKPTCTVEGYTVYTCSQCGDSYEDDFKPELDHNYNDGVVTKQAKEDTDGEILYTCQRCGETKTEVLPATGHEFDDGVVTKEPTCTEDGIITYTCTGCGKTITENIEAAGHSYSDSVVAPTCTEKGYTVHICTECKDSYQDSYTNALGHSWDNGTITKKPTVTAEGVKTFTCTRCKETRTEQLPRIAATKLKDNEVTVNSANLIYDGKAKQPSVTVVVGGKTLTKGTDYTVSYSNNTNAGTAKVTVIGKGNYTGTITKTFAIAKANQTLTVSALASLVKGKTVSVTAKGIGAVTYKSSNTKVATVSTKGVVKGVAPGTVTITVKAAGDKNHNATTKTVKITVYACANPSVSKVENVNGGVKLTWGKVAGAAKYRIFYKTGKGSWAKLADTTSTTYTWKKAKNGTTYSFTVRCISKDGKAYTSGYNTTGKSLTYVATPTLSSVKNSKAKTLTASWKKLSGVTGFQIQYSTDKSFKSGNKAVTVKKTSAVSQAISGLTKGKTYYVRIRSYKTVSGKNVYSAWSAAKSVKITK